MRNKKKVRANKKTYHSKLRQEKIIFLSLVYLLLFKKKYYFS